MVGNFYKCDSIHYHIKVFAARICNIWYVDELQGLFLAQNSLRLIWHLPYNMPKSPQHSLGKSEGLIRKQEG